MGFGSHGWAGGAEEAAALATEEWEEGLAEEYYHAGGVSSRPRAWSEEYRHPILSDCLGRSSTSKERIRVRQVVPHGVD